MERTFLHELVGSLSQGAAGNPTVMNQGVIGVQYWTGIEPDAAVMRKALESALGL